MSRDEQLALHHIVKKGKSRRALFDQFKICVGGDYLLLGHFLY